MGFVDLYYNDVYGLKLVEKNVKKFSLTKKYHSKLEVNELS